jgi:hypothetical protein
MLRNLQMRFTSTAPQKLSPQHAAQDQTPTKTARANVAHDRPPEPPAPSLRIRAGPARRWERGRERGGGRHELPRGKRFQSGVAALDAACSTVLTREPSEPRIGRARVLRQIARVDGGRLRAPWTVRAKVFHKSATLDERTLTACSMRMRLLSQNARTGAKLEAAGGMYGKRSTAAHSPKAVRSSGGRN